MKKLVIRITCAIMATLSICSYAMDGAVRAEGDPDDFTRGLNYYRTTLDGIDACNRTARMIAAAPPALCAAYLSVKKLYPKISNMIMRASWKMPRFFMARRPVTVWGLSIGAGLLAGALSWSVAVCVAPFTRIDRLLAYFPTCRLRAEKRILESGFKERINGGHITHAAVDAKLGEITGDNNHPLRGVERYLKHVRIRAWAHQFRGREQQPAEQ